MTKPQDIAGAWIASEEREIKRQQILEKALLKAHRNGWKSLMADWRNVQIEQWQGNQTVGIAFLYGTKGTDMHWVRELEGIIFNHDFAKALWGECTTWVRSKSGRVTHLPLDGWQYHLQQMVIADDPIKYLGENI